MQIQGRRFHIAGSASLNVDQKLLQYSHDLLKDLTIRLAQKGAKFLVSAGKEPHRENILEELPIIFDWTIITTIFELLKKGKRPCLGQQGKVLFTVVTQKMGEQIPQDRKDIWCQLLEKHDVEIKYIEPGWASGAVRRTMMSETGDILIILSGGEGVEHLALEYARRGKPVIPIDLDLGASKNDGTGGASRLAKKAMAHPERFFSLSNPATAGELLTRISTANGKSPVGNVSQSILDLIVAIEPPSAFYVRLLDPKDANYEETEDFFRNVVDPVIEDAGYKIIEMGRSFTTHPWMNQEIFEGLYYSAITVVDLTGVRSNCFTELGYALGLDHRVLLTAKEKTELPFDSKMLDCYFWDPKAPKDKKILKLKEYWDRNINRPPLVKPREIL